MGLLFASQAEAVTVYVHAGCSNNSTAYNPAGSGACTGGSDRVFSGIQNGVDWAGLAPGDTIDVRAGTYAEAINITASHPSGTAGNPITVRGHVGEIVQTRGAGFEWEANRGYWTFDNLIMEERSSQNATFFTGLGNHHIKIQNSELKNSLCMGIQGFGSFLHVTNTKVHDMGLGCSASEDGHAANIGYGVYWQGSDAIFEFMEVYNNRGWGFHIYDSGQSGVSRNTIRYSRIHGNCNSPEFGNAILIANGDDNQVYGNLVYNNTNCYGAISTGSTTTTNPKIYNNTLYNNGTNGLFPGDPAIHIGVGPGERTSGAIVQNNILYQNAGNGISDEGTGSTISNNHCDSPGTGCITTGNPRFADAPNGDFRLCTAAGVPHASCVGASPAIDQGATLGPPWNLDFSGSARPQGTAYDIGAYEGQGTGPEPPPVGECPANALVAQYGFDGNPNDSSGNGNHASLNLNVIYATGKYGQGIQFPGTAGAIVPHSPTLYLPCGFTFEAWIDIPATLTDFAALITSDYNGQDGFFLYAGSTRPNNAPLAGYCAGVNCPEVLAGTLSTAMTHIAATWDNSLGSANLKMFINGLHISSANGAATLADWAGNMNIGFSPFGEFLPNLTIVDEIRIYNYARTAAQIAANMLLPIASPTVPVGVKVSGNTVFKVGPGVSFKFGLVP